MFRQLKPAIHDPDAIVDLVDRGSCGFWTSLPMLRIFHSRTC